MHLSQNEVATLGKRAARGAGLPWGLAEEAGQALRWLTNHGFPGGQALINVLRLHQAKSYRELAPNGLDGVWHSLSGRLCPLISGITFSDQPGQILPGQGINLGPTTRPIMLAPFAATAARRLDQAIALDWDGTTIIFLPNGTIADGYDIDANAETTDSVSCRIADPTHVARTSTAVGQTCELAPRIIDQLKEFGFQTLVPATEESRLAGAGAGLTDND